MASFVFTNACARLLFFFVQCQITVLHTLFRIVLFRVCIRANPGLLTTFEFKSLLTQRIAESYIDDHGYGLR